MKTEAVSHDRSRVLGVARSVVGQPLDPETAYSRLVVLTGDAATLTTHNGQCCFIDALHLLCRTVGRLHVHLPTGVDGAFGARIRGLTEQLWSRRAISFTHGAQELEACDATAILNVGSAVRADLPWTSINCNGWVARVSSTITAVAADCDQPNAVSAMLAAAFGVSEVFKRVFEVPASSAPLLDAVEFSLFNHQSASSGLDIGPILPTGIRLPDTVVFGAGAIGNVVALLLSQLPLNGRVHLIDKQSYAAENAETCSQVERQGWVGVSKAERLAQWLAANSGLSVTGEQALADEAINLSKVLQSMRVDLILNGFDDIQARHDVQRLWPSVLVDGGISQVSAGVTQYRVADDAFACMRCSFELPEVDLRAHNERVVGLRLSAEETDRLITDEDILAASQPFQEPLRQAQKAGKKLCSVIADAGKVLEVELAEGFQPSAPFVAAASAALMLAEALKAILFPQAAAVQQFQFGNLLLGPEANASMRTVAKPDCHCVTHRALHLRYAKKRG